MKKKIFVTQPTLPDLKEFTNYLEKIWKSKWLTNNGQFHQEFENKLAKHLGVKYISLFSNGTLALITALQHLEIKGEIITTPYSFVATAHSIIWNGLKPVFADVDPIYGNLNPREVEKLVNDKTEAIMPVHVYGNPCQVKEFERIGKKYNLKIIYDAAHAFGVEKEGQSILNFGDLSILSFHATKVFNTIEGGAIISHSAQAKKKIDYLKNFGFSGETSVEASGINAKLNELQSAFGLLQLESIDKNILKRKEISNRYYNNLTGKKGISLIPFPENIKLNYSYFPILINEKEFGGSRDNLYEKLKDNGIYGRRYFFPLITDFEYYSKSYCGENSYFPIASDISKSVICLPLYADLEYKQVDAISKIILS